MRRDCTALCAPWLSVYLKPLAPSPDQNGLPLPLLPWLRTKRWLDGVPPGADESSVEASMKAILYDVHSYERAAFDRANGAKTHQLTYVSGPLDPTTAGLAEGHPAVIPSLSDVVDAPILETLAKLGVRLIRLRSAGYSNA